MKKRNISIKQGRDITLFAGVWTFVAVELYAFGFYWNEVTMYVVAAAAGVGAAIATAITLALITE